MPVELDGVAAYGVGAGWAGGGLVHLQELGGFGLGLAGDAAFELSFFDAGGAWAGVAEPLEGPAAQVSVGPVDLHPGAFGFEDADFGRGEGFFGVSPGVLVFLVLLFLFFLA